VAFRENSKGSATASALAFFAFGFEGAVFVVLARVSSRTPLSLRAH
jgi:hypothetical protein